MIASSARVTVMVLVFAAFACSRPSVAPQAPATQAPIAPIETSVELRSAAAPPLAFTDPGRRARLEATFPRIRAMVAERMRRDELVGLAYGVVLDSDLALVDALGLADRETKLPVTPDSLFAIASITKLFTAAAVLSLLDSGELELDTPAHAYVPARRIVVRVAADDENKLQAPKSGKNRAIDLGDDVLEDLKAHRHLRSHVFDNADGSILTASQCRKALDRITRRAGLREIGWHVLRHTFASHMFMTGAHPTEVQETMGHATLTMTMRYAHLSPHARREALRRLDRNRRGVTTGVTNEEADTRSKR